MQQTFDAIIIGGGAAGLFCAAEAGKRGRRVVVLERAGRIGKKILISGGGRCNFTNLYCGPENFLSSNPHFCKSALARYGSDDFVKLVERHRIAYREKTKGQLFCVGSAVEIVQMLEKECLAGGVQVVTNCDISEVTRGSEYSVRTSTGHYRASTLVVACGGLSISKIGATGLGYDLARQFGTRIVPCRPGLVPLVWNEQDRRRFADLTGVSTEVDVRCGRQRFREKLLFTHRGLSGPAVLQISSYWREGDSITIDLAPGRDVTASVRATGAGRDLPKLKSALKEVLPARLADRWLENNPPQAWSNQALLALENQLHNWEVTPAGTEGYEKAEVTAGGVDTDELSAKTMQSRKVPGLYFIGEVVDVTGQLGGFNFQWAWSSAFSAAQSL